MNWIVNEEKEEYKKKWKKSGAKKERKRWRKLMEKWGKESRHLEDGMLQDEWCRAATWSVDHSR